ncbi:hypothetical protein GCM10010082_31190 [Kushneria pakistanensis]|uniref:Uncharacterized protein n=1 Tax=Kushneria pakistanensis TaxID=1508770 RepID=A0ABQ3FR57_9GAMM|nr:hypothetical protein [Kushneria pakistanensis]GHC34251.1 hypothetical protein GCM10010082_31190 [Kushneria pakistanensis]
MRFGNSRKMDARQHIFQGKEVIYFFSNLWDWIQENATVFSGLTSVGMLLIWGVYLQLLLHNFRMQRRPQIIINHGYGRGIDSRCIVSNMSQSAVFIDSIIVKLETSDGQYVTDVTDTVDEEGESSKDVNVKELRQVTRQGPLGSGEYMNAGTFRTLLQKVASEHGIGLDESCRPTGEEGFSNVEIRLIMIFGAEKSPIGASRRFHMKYDENKKLSLIPETIGTQQLGKRRQRLKVRRWQRDLRMPFDADTGQNR